MFHLTTSPTISTLYSATPASALATQVYPISAQLMKTPMPLSAFIVRVIINQHNALPKKSKPITNVVTACKMKIMLLKTSQTPITPPANHVHYLLGNLKD